MSLFLGLDIGSTSVKALLKDEKGSTVAVGRCAYPTNYAPGGVVTQDARDWWAAAVTAVREATSGHGKEVSAIGLPCRDRRGRAALRRVELDGRDGSLRG